jgi:alpha-ketoglutarate-dependent taurine dioxygenase
MELQPLGPVLGVEVTGVDLSEPLDNARFAVIRQALNDHCLVLVRGQALSEGAHVAFARRFGELQIHVLKQFLTTPYPELYVLSNKAVDGKPIGNHKEGWNWHSDLSYLEIPCLGSVLYAREVPPEGADTLFASMYAAYDALDAATKATIADLKAVHSYAGYYAKYFADRTPLSETQKAATPDVIHPIVRTHPETGRKSLYVGQDIVKEILGLPAQEGAALLARLNSHAISEDFTYRHRWRVGDVVIWDNRSTMHKATPYDDKAYIRIMHRATIKGSDRPA